jgi:hypothetical protein
MTIAATISAAETKFISQSINHCHCYKPYDELPFFLKTETSICHNRSWCYEEGNVNRGNTTNMILRGIQTTIRIGYLCKYEGIILDMSLKHQFTLGQPSAEMKTKVTTLRPQQPMTFALNSLPSLRFGYR